MWDQAPGDPVADWTLALFRGTVANPPARRRPSRSRRPTTVQARRNVFRENGDATYVGRGIHPDAQSIAFSRRADNTGLDGTDVWIGCDGGLFRSTASGALGTLHRVQHRAGHHPAHLLASHPTLESVALAGCQDNGTVRWRAGRSGTSPPWTTAAGSRSTRTTPTGCSARPSDLHAPHHDRRRDRSLLGGRCGSRRTANTSPRRRRRDRRAGNSAFYSPIVDHPGRRGADPGRQGHPPGVAVGRLGDDVGDAAHGDQPLRPRGGDPRPGLAGCAGGGAGVPERGPALRRHGDRGVPVHLRRGRVEPPPRCPPSRACAARTRSPRSPRPGAHAVRDGRRGRGGPLLVLRRHDLVRHRAAGDGGRARLGGGDRPEQPDHGVRRHRHRRVPGHPGRHGPPRRLDAALGWPARVGRHAPRGAPADPDAARRHPRARGLGAAARPGADAAPRALPADEHRRQRPPAGRGGRRRTTRTRRAPCSPGPPAPTSGCGAGWPPRRRRRSPAARCG